MPNKRIVLMNYMQQLSAYNVLINILDVESARLRKEAAAAKKKAIYNLNKCKQYASLLKNRNRIVKHKRRRFWSIVEKSWYWEKEVPRFDYFKFKNTFRVSRQTFNYIKIRIEHLARQETKFRSPIHIDKRLAIALYALGSSAEYRTIASLFGVGRTTVGEIVLEISREIFQQFKAECFNTYPPTPRKIDEIVCGFEILGFPQCFGAIDGCHIEVHPPKEQATDYYNFKGWYSVILLAVVDYRYRFTYCNVGSPGRMNDSGIFEMSKVKAEHQCNPLFQSKSKLIEGVKVPVLLIGDSAFRISNILMKPYPYSTTQSHEERLFNYHLSKCRRVVENAFGQLKAGFRRIGKGLEVHVDNANVLINACCILHNICNDHNDTCNQSWFKDLSSQSDRIQPQTRTSVGDGVESDGNRIRKAICTCLARGDGAGGDFDADDAGLESNAEVDAAVSLTSEI